MKKYAFSFIEIIFFIFIVVTLTFFIFPLKMVNINRAEKIAAWKSYYPTLKYSFDNMQIFEQDFIKEFKEDKTISADKYFEIFANYLNPKEEGIIFDKKAHKYHFSNGKLITHKSKYKTYVFVITKDDIIISFNGIEDRTNVSETEPIGIMLIDLNKSNKHNILGEDTFAVELYLNNIEPVGKNMPIDDMKRDCSIVGSGISCSSYYLLGVE